MINPRQAYYFAPTAEVYSAQEYEALAAENERLRDERDAWEAAANGHYSEAFALRAQLALAVEALRCLLEGVKGALRRIEESGWRSDDD